MLQHNPYFRRDLSIIAGVADILASVDTQHHLRQLELANAHRGTNSDSAVVYRSPSMGLSRKTTNQERSRKHLNTC